jgi:hypothetical protein
MGIERDIKGDIMGYYERNHKGMMVRTREINPQCVACFQTNEFACIIQPYIYMIYVYLGKVKRPHCDLAMFMVNV